MSKIYRDSLLSDSYLFYPSYASLAFDYVISYQLDGSIGVRWEMAHDYEDVKYHISITHGDDKVFDQDVEGNYFNLPDIGSGTGSYLLELEARSPYYNGVSYSEVLEPINKGIGVMRIISDTSYPDPLFVVGGEIVYEGVGSRNYRVGTSLVVN